MNLRTLSLRNITDNPFRSWVVFICAAILGGLIMGTTIILWGSEQSLQLVVDRLGADITVIPSGNQVIVEQAFLMGIPASVWMDRSVVDEVGSIEGVEVVSPQLFLSTMRGASCCSVSDMFMIAYDPATDFTVHPWMEENLQRELQIGEGIGGTHISVSKDRDDILVYGYEIELLGNLEPTGSGLDQSLFFTYDTALEIARLSPMQAERALIISPDSISTALVKLEDGADARLVADAIEAAIPGVSAIPSSSLFSAQKDRVLSLIRSVTILASLAWIMSLLLIGIVTSTTVAARRHEIGALRALGATRFTIVKSLMIETVILVLTGSGVGILIAIASITLFRNLIMRIMQAPFLIPPPLSLALIALTILCLVVLSGILATFLPTMKYSNQEPGTSIKEW